MSSTSIDNCPEKNFANLISIFCLVLINRSCAEGAHSNMLGSKASVISAPLRISSFGLLPAEFTSATACLHRVLYLAGGLSNATMFIFRMVAASTDAISSHAVPVNPSFDPGQECCCL